MKTLCFSLLLLLVVIFYCDAIPQGVQHTVQQSRVRCCAAFKSEHIPTKKIVRVTKTPITCMKKGYVVETEKGKFFCYYQNSKWAQSLYDQFQKTKDQRQKN